MQRLDLDKSVVDRSARAIDQIAVVLARSTWAGVGGEVSRLDVDAVAAAALEKIDLTEIVLQQVDLVRVVEYVVQAIDLPEIIRESTGTVASETVRGLRMQGVDADVAVARIADRLLHRRRRKTGGQPIPPQAEPPSAEGSPAEAPTAEAPTTEAPVAEAPPVAATNEPQP